ncbi:hypothetical protein GCM10023196_010680 [Actinoallomurus vinaceus]|uniref:Uncharacterized protein n=1 Tax=Actinoallomurus vinaceus TaxID=1080074 RepID=A0ABP8U4Z6_9ACTN
MDGRLCAVTTRPPAEAAILVTGATGNVGRELVRERSQVRRSPSDGRRRACGVSGGGTSKPARKLGVAPPPAAHRPRLTAVRRVPYQAGARGRRRGRAWYD